jgi:hypothetical protein
MIGARATDLAHRWVDDAESLDAIDWNVLASWVIERAGVYTRKFKRAGATEIAEHIAEGLTISWLDAWRLCEKIQPAGWS